MNSVSISSFFVKSNRGCLLEYSHSVGLYKILSVNPLNKKALLRMSTKTLNFLRSLDVVLPFCFQFFLCFQFFFYEIYKEFLVYLISRLNLAINKQSEKFWYGINDKASMGEYGKESEKNGGV